MTVILATGGSAGHLFPAIEVAKELVSKQHKVLFLGAIQVGQKSLVDNRFEYKNIKSKGLQGRSFISDFFAGCSLIIATCWVFCLFLRNRPKVVVGFGGYGAFPVVLAGCILNIPTIIHEQNAVPGRANALLGRWVRKIAVSFAQTENYFERKKVVHTGCPIAISNIQHDKEALLSEFKLQSGRITILVFGGSQGSEKINSVFCDAVKGLTKHMNLQVFHVTGRGKLKGIEELYTELGIPAVVKEFYGAMEKAYTVSDVVVSRSGASTVNEIALFRKPAVIVPYPYAGGHQKENALILQKFEIASILEEDKLMSDQLQVEIKSIIEKDIRADHFDLLIEELKMHKAANRIAVEIERFI